MNVVMTIIQIAYIVLWMYVYSYITNLEKIGCVCSQDWKRDYIKFYVILMIPLMILRILDILPHVLTGFTFVFSIFFIFATYRYIHELRAKKCACSNAPVRDVLEIVNYIQLGLLGIAVILIVFIVTANFFSKKSMFSLGSLKKGNKSKSTQSKSKSTPSKRK